MPPSKKRLSLPGWLLVIVTAAAFLFHGPAVWLLSLWMDKHGPDLNNFLGTPGGAAMSAAVLFGLCYIGPQWSTRPYAKMFTIGFVLYLLGALADALVNTWMHQNQGELQTGIAGGSKGDVFWTWWFRLNIPSAISAIGMLLIVMAGMGATCTSCKAPAK